MPTNDAGGITPGDQFTDDNAEGERTITITGPGLSHQGENVHVYTVDTCTSHPTTVGRTYAVRAASIRSRYTRISRTPD